MSIELWSAFALASLIVLAIPGPTVLLVVSYALGFGRGAAAVTVAGVALGDFTAMTASVLGLGVVLATSATLFGALKWIGGLYLIYLGVKLWRAPASFEDGAASGLPMDARRVFLHAYAVTALNPKSIVFFVAFLPLFLDATAPPIPQLAAMETTFVALAAANAFAYAWLAARARRAIRRPVVQRAVNRLGGSFLIGAGVLTAAWRRAEG